MRNAMSVSKLKYATLKNSSGLYNWSSTNRKDSEKPEKAIHVPLEIESTGTLSIPEKSPEGAQPAPHKHC